MKVEDAADEAQEKLDPAELIEQIDIGAKAAEDAINRRAVSRSRSFNRYRK